MPSKESAVPVATLTFLDAEHGGRTRPPQTGYRPHVELRGTQTSCTVDSLDGHAVFDFGKEYRVSLKLMFPQQYPDAFAVGDEVRLYEGSRLVGQGRVVEL